MLDHLTPYLERLEEEKGLASNTLLSYKRDITQFLDYLKLQGIPLELSSRTHLQGYLLALRKLDRAPATIGRCLVSLRSFYTYLLEKNVVERDPTLQLEAPKPERRPPAVLTVEQVGELLAAPTRNTLYGLRDKAMLELLYATGIRVTELVSLDIGHVYLELGFIRCKGKGERERVIPINVEARFWLDRFLKEVRPQWPGLTKGEEALFINHLGNRLTRQGFWKIIKKYAEDLGMEESITPHTLRHSFAAHLLNNGADARALQEMLGHADLSSTMLYARTGETRMKDVYNMSHPRAQLRFTTEGSGRG